MTTDKTLIIPTHGPFEGRGQSHFYDTKIGRLTIKQICEMNGTSLSTFKTRKKKGELVLNNPRIFRPPERAKTRWADELETKKTKKKKTPIRVKGSANDNRYYGKGPEDYRTWKRNREEKKRQEENERRRVDLEYLEMLTGCVKAGIRSSIW